MSEGIAQELQAAGIKRARVAEPMARHTSWRIGGPADVFCTVETEQELRAAVDVAKCHDLPWLVLGGGNNILVSDGGIEGLVILNRLRGLAIEGGSNGHPVLACGAGVFFARAAQYSAHNGFTGMEWGIAIPGTVGGGVVNNAGAHSSEVSSALVSADVLDAAGKTDRLTPDDLAYRYRESRLKTPRATRSPLVVTSCRFRLERGDPDVALQRIEELRDHRLRTQPVKEASAGSTFVNPPGDAAGALIDRAGLKGRRIGDAQISPLHANFILNLGRATAEDVISLIRLARRDVRDRFGVELHPEVQLIGRWPDGVLADLEPVHE